MASTIKKYTLESFSECTGISNVVKVGRKSVPGGRTATPLYRELASTQLVAQSYTRILVIFFLLLQLRLNVVIIGLVLPIGVTVSVHT